MAVIDKTAEDQWRGHVLSCGYCQLYIDGDTRTLAHLCLQGVPLLKAVLERVGHARHLKQRRADRAVYKHQMPDETTKKKAKELTRYKE